MAITKNQVTNEEKEAVIAQALQTEEGRIALAQAMVGPIKERVRLERIWQQQVITERARGERGSCPIPKRGINWNSHLFIGD